MLNIYESLQAAARAVNGSHSAISNIINHKKQTINIPYYMIQRSVYARLNANFDKHVLHLIRGRRISGRTYMLVDLFYSNKSSKVYIFDSMSRISTQALKKLLAEKNTLQLYDINALTREQFELVISNLDTLHKNSNNIVVALSNNYSDLFGIIKYRLNSGKIDKKYIYEYDLDNRFSDSELKLLNDAMGYVGLPAFNYGKTIIDNLVNAEIVFSKAGRFSGKNYDISKSSVKDLALLIMLATKNRVTSFDLINFNLEHEMFYCLSKYDPISLSLFICLFS